MARGGAGNMLGVGGTRSNMGRKALRGGRNDGRVGSTLDPQAQKRELLRKLQEKRGQEQRAGQQTEQRPEQQTQQRPEQQTQQRSERRQGGQQGRTSAGGTAGETS